MRAIKYLAILAKAQGLGGSIFLISSYAFKLKILLPTAIGCGGSVFLEFAFIANVIYTSYTYLFLKTYKDRYESMVS